MKWSHATAFALFILMLGWTGATVDFKRLDLKGVGSNAATSVKQAVQELAPRSEVRIADGAQASNTATLGSDVTSWQRINGEQPVAMQSSGNVDDLLRACELPLLALDTRTASSRQRGMR